LGFIFIFIFIFCYGCRVEVSLLVRMDENMTKRSGTQATRASVKSKMYCSDMDNTGGGIAPKSLVVMDADDDFSGFDSEKNS
jgi:hypothetical protein